MPASHKAEKIKESLKHLAAEFLERESNRTSLITVTGATLSPRSERATVLVTVLPEKEEAAALAFANRTASRLREFVGRRLAMHRLPFISFALDKSEKMRQKLDTLSGENC